MFFAYDIATKLIKEQEGGRKVNKTRILWVNKEDLSKKAIDALEEILGEIELFQLGDLEENPLAIAEKFESVDIIAFQKSSLPPDLQESCLEKRHIIHRINGDFHFIRWELPE